MRDVSTETKEDKRAVDTVMKRNVRRVSEPEPPTVRRVFFPYGHNAYAFFLAEQMNGSW